MSAKPLFQLIQASCSRTWQVHHFVLLSEKLTPWPHYTPAPMMPTFFLWLMSVSFVLCELVISWCLFRCRCLDNRIDVVLFEEKWMCELRYVVSRCLRKAMLVEFRDGRGTMEICVALQVAQQPTSPRIWRTSGCPYSSLLQQHDSMSL